MSKPSNPIELAHGLAREQLDPDDVLECLELAAALGPRVSVGEWSAAGRQLGISCDANLLDTLVDAGIARRDGDAWEFTDQDLVDELGRSSSTNGRWARQRAACARALYEVHPMQSPAVAARRATHLIEAGKFEAALAPLLITEQMLYDRGDYARAEATLDEYDQLLDELEVDESDPTRGRSLWRRGRLLFTQGQRQTALALTERGESMLTNSQFASERGEAALQLGRMLRDAGELDEARAKLKTAVECFGAAGDNRGLALSRAGLAMVLLAAGQSSDAVDLLDQARVTFEALDEAHMVGSVYIYMAQAWHYQGDRLQATTCVERAREVARQNDDLVNEAAAWNFEGEIARENQDWSYARRCYKLAAERYDQIGSASAKIVRFNLALAEIGLERFEAADDMLQQLEAEYVDAGFEGRLPLVYSARVAALAGMHDWDAMDACLSQLRDSLERFGIAHHDIVDQLERAAEFVHNADQSELGERVESICATQREALR